MPNATDLLGFGVQGLATGYKIFDTIRKNTQAKAIEKKTVRPVFNRAGEIDQVYQLAGSELNNDAQKDFASQQLAESESNGIDAILKSGGKADFETIHNSYGKNLSHLLFQLSRDRDSKVANFNNAAYNVARAKDAEFQYNKDAPYKDALQKAAELRGQAEQSKNEAFSLAGGAIANYGISQDRPGQYGKVGGEIATIPTSSLAATSLNTPGYVPGANTIGTIGPSAGALEAAGRTAAPTGPELDYFGNLKFHY